MNSINRSAGAYTTKYADNQFCVPESQAVYKCLDKNDYEKDKCSAFFQAYKDCKRQWNEERAKERARMYQDRRYLGFGTPHSELEQEKQEAAANAAPPKKQAPQEGAKQ